MKTEQPEALRIAEWFEGGYGGCEYEAATELRRLHKVNQELLEALKAIIGDKPVDKYGYAAARNAMDDDKRQAARAAITKGEQA